MITSNQHAIEFNMAGVTELKELTTQINHLCDQAEDGHAMIVLRLTACFFNWMDSPHPMSIQDINRWERTVRRLERLPSAIIAMISGTPRGPALDLLLAADYRIATTNFCLSISLHKACVWPGMIIHRLVNQIGVTRSRQLLVGAHEMTAEQAIAIGLVDEISNSDDALNTALSRFALMPGTELAIRRQLILDATTMTFEDALGPHLAACDRELRRINNWQPGHLQVHPQ